MAEVAGLLLSPFLQVLFERVASREFVDFFRSRKLDSGLLKRLEIVLMSANAVLEDAEELQFTKDAVKKWLDELKDAVYDAEDILDEIHTEVLRCKLDAEFQTISTKVLKTISTSLNPFVREIELKIKDVLKTLDHLVQQKDAIGLKESVGGKSTGRLPTTSLVTESDIFGRTEDKEAIINLLLSDNVSGNIEWCVIAIVGMGGLGKTTLAQLVYNDDRMERPHFDLKVCWNKGAAKQKIVREKFASRRVTNVAFFKTIFAPTINGMHTGYKRICLQDTMKPRTSLFV